MAKNLTANAGDTGGAGSIPGAGNGNPLPYSCLENPHGQRSLEGYSPRGHKESDTTERLNNNISESQRTPGRQIPPLCFLACLSAPQPQPLLFISRLSLQDVFWAQKQVQVCVCIYPCFLPFLHNRKCTAHFVQSLCRGFERAGLSSWSSWRSRELDGPVPQQGHGAEPESTSVDSLAQVPPTASPIPGSAVRPRQEALLKSWKAA